MSKILPLKRIIGKSYGNINGFANFFRDNRHIYMPKIEHPFWKSYQTFSPVPYTLRSLAKLCHFCNQIPEGNRKPFIIDCEHPLIISGRYRDYVYMINSVSEIEKKLLNERCKAIFVPSEGAIREFMKYFNSTEIMEKIHIIRPAYPKQDDNKHNHSGPFTILIVGNKFWGKGIPIAIEVFRILRKKYRTRVRMQLVCGDIPSDYILPEGVELLKVPQMTAFIRSKVYKEAHVFIFPCLHDSYAVYQESMAYGVPMIATRIYDKDELVLDGITGYLVDTPISLYDGAFGVDWKTWDRFQEIVKTKFEQKGFSKMIDEIVAKTDLLINDINLLKNMGVAAQELHRRKFSPELRNRKVRQIYDEILQAI